MILLYCGLSWPIFFLCTKGTFLYCQPQDLQQVSNADSACHAATSRWSCSLFYVLDILLAIIARWQSAKAKRIGLETHQSLSRSPIVGRSACHAATIRWPCSSLFIRSVNLKSIMGHTILKISHAPSLSCVQLYRRRDVLHMGQDVGYDEVWWTKYE